MTTIISGSSPSITFSDSTTQSTTAPSTSTFGFKNRIINGGMVIDQRNAGASVTPTDGQYTLDRWLANASAASKFTVQQNAGSITPPAGFSNYLGCTSSSAYSVGSGETFAIQQRIEGFNTSDLGWGTANAKTVTLSAWVYSSLTGTFGGSITNSAVNYSYPFSYSIPVANTWTQISVTIAGPTSGTWIGATNGTGMCIFFSIGTGSTRSGTAGSWSANLYTSATGATSVVGTSGATFYLTGVQLEVGTQATSFDFRSIGQESSLCYRYYYRWGPSLGQLTVYAPLMHNITANNAYGAFTLPVVLRSNPTLTTNGTAGDYGAYQAATELFCNSVPLLDTLNTFTPSLTFAYAGSLTVGGTTFPRAVFGVGSFLGFSAEL